MLPAGFRSVALLTLLFVSAASAADLTEQYERDVDKVAAASQEQAIGKLSALLKKYRNTRQEPVLLARLAELQQQQGAILFRVAHGNAHRTAGKQAVQLGAYNKAMKGSIDTLNALISRYPGYEEMPLAYFMRARAREELGDKNSAAKDYSHLVAKFPDAPETPPAYMALAEFAIAANDHSRAVALLTNVEKLPDNPHYPFALYKLAWSHFNLKSIHKSLSYIERHIAYYREKLADVAPDGTTDSALVSNSLMDSATFYFEGFEQGDSAFPASGALKYFRKLETGPALGKMLLRFTRLLRSHAHEKELLTWKDELLLAEGNRPEIMDVVLTVYEHQRNKRQYPQLIESARDMVRIYDASARNAAFAEGFRSAQKVLIETADGLHSVIQKNKNADGVKALSANLAAIYDAFTRIVEESDLRVPRVHYNLAETLFLIGDYPGATEHYRWVIEHGKWQADPSIKAIAARYEVLKQRRLAGVDVAARPFSENSDRKPDPIFSEWVSWVDDHADRAEKSDEKVRGDNFLFEANRALYAQGAIVDATKRMVEFAESIPASKYAIPSASLVLDTYLASSAWKDLYEIAKAFLDEKAWKKTDFHARLQSVAADSYYKIIEGLYKESRFDDVLKEAERFVAEYRGNARHTDCLNLAGKAALAVGRPDIARGHFSRVIVAAPQSQNASEALLARALISEKRHDVAAAAADYRAYLAGSKQKPKEFDALRRKTLFLAWLSADPAELRGALDTPVICAEGLAEDCDRFRALAALGISGGGASERAGNLEQTSAALERVRKTEGENRTVWAALALEGVKHLSFRDRLYLLRQVASGWEDADPLVKYALLPNLTVSIPRAFQLNRMSMAQTAPLRAHEKYITRRVEVIREIENAAIKVVKLPWARIRAEVLNEVASVYLDFTRELAAIPAPKDLADEDKVTYEDTIRKLVLPFEEKGQEMRRKAFEIASQFLVEESSVGTITGPFFAENPSQSKRFRSLADRKLPQAPVATLDLEFLDQLDENLDWRSLMKSPADESKPGRKIRKLWAQALSDRKWQQVAFFLQEAAQLRDENAVTPAVLGLMKALTLSVAGARGEGLVELENARSGLDPRRGALATLLLVHYAVQSFSPPKVEELLKQLPAEHLSRDEASYVAALVPAS
ncbi:MAG: hypothetical protein A2X94_06350 [Bdellovibrionales bacterium GWB1_55_8]|nr:MAG: hypothetical protein A2X94_06350 [Bdellovibrionales bacterium GWB1_55_8]